MCLELVYLFPETKTDKMFILNNLFPASDGDSVVEGLAHRRGAVKHQKVHQVRGHRFLAKFFRQPTVCTFCKDFLWFVFIRMLRKHILSKM